MENSMEPAQAPTTPPPPAATAPRRRLSPAVKRALLASVAGCVTLGGVLVLLPDGD
ncbi:hypothetical protein G3I40_31050, partial [Streptomyces sp. SID14478]|nr:hypothetical protein [Streptomyces sp. SID14478]